MLNGQAYLTLGTGASTYYLQQDLGDSTRYHLRSDPGAQGLKWTTKAPMPSPMGGLGNMAAAGPNGKIYVFGGSSNNSTYIDLNQEYDPAADSWALKSPLPGGPRANGGVAAAQGKIYVIGGYPGPVANNLGACPRTNV